MKTLSDKRGTRFFHCGSIQFQQMAACQFVSNDL